MKLPQKKKTTDEIASGMLSTVTMRSSRGGQSAVLSTLLLAPLALIASAWADTAGTTGSDNSSPRLDEIVVTAQKKSERLQDVPVPVAEISASNLVENSQLRLADYFQTVPGLSYTSDGNDGTLLSIRGLSSGTGGNATVLVTLDDIPLQAATTNNGGAYVPEIDPHDLASVEVLRGPQGTLYGGSTLGGLLKYVSIEPSTSAVSGRMQVGVSGVHNGAGAGYNVSGAINIPLNDTMALRASAFTHEDPGYIDNPVLGLKGVNESQTSGGHLTGMWSPSDAFSLRLSALYQHSKIDGSFQVQPSLGDLQQNFVRDTGDHTWELAAFGATLRAKIGIADLTSATGYMSRKVKGSDDFVDFAPLYDSLSQFVYNTAPGSIGTPVFFDAQVHKFSEELRLTVPLGQRVDWLVGLYYTHETGFQNNNLAAAYPATGQVLGPLYIFNWKSPYIEKAVFTDFTVHFTDHFDLQVGGRESHIEQIYNEVDDGPFAALLFPTVPFVYPEVDAKANAFTYLFTPRYKFSDDLMAYVRIASGYRPGGPNAGSTAYGYQTSFSPDKTQNYEIGVKGDTLEHRLSFDASLFYINWKDIQLPATFEGFYPYLQNGSKAKSQGIELSSQFKPVSSLTLAGWVSYNEAELSENFPGGSSNYGVSGDRLPFVSRISGNISVDQDFRLTSRVTAFVGATESYVGNRLGNFVPAVTPGVVPPRQEYGGFATAALRAGVRFDQWTAQLYATNLMDKRGELSGGLGASPYTTSRTIITPRTVGLNMFTTF